MKGILYLVGTPIGNLNDLSPRAAETLASVDFIAAEDTRVTVKLLNNLNIKKPMISYYEHNMLQKGDYIISRILSGENCAIVTDAGMPCISDPGELLVKQAAEAGIEIYVIPGPSAVVSALAVSGLETGRFAFEGFLTVNKTNRIKRLEELVTENRTMIFYEAPHKLLNTLTDMYKYFGNRKISIVKEITKIHENVQRTTLEEAVKYYNENSPKGEFVLVVEGAEIIEESQMSFEEAINFAKGLMDDGLSSSNAAKQASKLSGIPKSIIYKEIIK